MKLGLYGGTFDPVHFGHLILAETVREECGLDEIWFIPAWVSPHKQEKSASSPQVRLDMLRLATAGHPQFHVSDLEIRRGGPSFTVQTLRELKSQRPDDELFLLIGGDSLHDFATWREPVAILELATVVAVNRGRTPLDLPAVLQQLEGSRPQQFVLVEMPAIDLSATCIRECCRLGKSIRYQTPRAVELFIQQRRLYCE